MDIRLLKANEIECRTQSVKKTSKGVGAIILLYKDARCDMKILDEVFGVLGWEREHQLINGNLFCTVRVWDIDKQAWVSKQDVGTESNTEKEKGQASDSFKRACFNLGIGRELYTAPFIWINLNQDEYSEYNGKVQCNAKFSVKSIAYNEEKEIIGLEVVDSKENIRYKLGSKPKPLTTEWHKQNAEQFTSKSIEHSKIHIEVTGTQQNNKNTNTPTDNKQGSNSIIQCEKCHTQISEKVAMWSTSSYGKKLCLNCQKKEAKGA